jgi:hypothetical protein
VEISVKGINEEKVNLINVALKPNEAWQWVKVRLAGQFVDSRVIKKVNKVYLNQHVVNNIDLVPNLKDGEDFVLALVTFGVLLYIY